MRSVQRAAVLFVSAALTLGAAPAIAAPVSAAPVAAPHEGEQYVRLQHPQPVRDPAVREVVEVFWYGCEHSQLLEQPLEAWAARQPSDVVLRRLPAVWAGSPDEAVQRAHARLYFTLDQLGQAARLQSAVFQAVRDQRVDLTTEESAARWAAGQHLDVGRFRAAYESEQVRRETDRAPEDLARYEITELPSAVVQGTYRTGPSRTDGVAGLPAVLDQLLERVRTTRR